MTAATPTTPSLGRLRSLLFVPADRPERFDKAQRSGADAVILDLEDAVALSNKAVARHNVRDALKQGPRSVPWLVRINAVTTDFAAADIEAARGADAIVLPKAQGAACVRRVVELLGNDAIPVLPLVTETARAMFVLGEYADVAAHLCALTWGAEDLPAAIGAATNREADGRYTPPFEVARALTLFAAAAAEVPALETVYSDFRDLNGLAAYAARGARDGFTGMLAIHPAQVPVINNAFTPSAAAVAHARAVVAAFEASPGAGVLVLAGKMIDAPHLKAAQRVLERAGGS